MRNEKNNDQLCTLIRGPDTWIFYKKYQNYKLWASCFSVTTPGMSLYLKIIFLIYQQKHMLWVLKRNVREGSGSVLECLTWDRGVAGSSLTGVTVLCPWARQTNTLLSTGSTQKDLSCHIWKIVYWDAKKQIKQTNNRSVPMRRFFLAPKIHFKLDG